MDLWSTAAPSSFESASADLIYSRAILPGPEGFASGLVSIAPRWHPATSRRRPLATDLLGAVRWSPQLSKRLHARQERYDYDAYGSTTIYSADWSTTASTSAVGNTILFEGQDVDPVTGLQYARARWYNAALGSFISRDPTGFSAGDANLYRYGGNSPLNGTDPSGEAFDLTDSSVVWPMRHCRAASIASVVERGTAADTALPRSSTVEKLREGTISSDHSVASRGETLI